MNLCYSGFYKGLNHGKNGQKGLIDVSYGDSSGKYRKFGKRCLYEWNCSELKKRNYMICYDYNICLISLSNLNDFSTIKILNKENSLNKHIFNLFLIIKVVLNLIFMFMQMYL
jgi:hypothetical protein